MTHDESKCREIFALLSQYLDMELPPEACESIAEHMAGCSPCVEFAESLRKTIELCGRYEPTTMPAPLSDQARRELQDAWQKIVGAAKAAPND